MRYTRLLAAAVTAAIVSLPSVATDRVVILHTNDTHSQIDPDESGLGGIVRRKALVDSVRRAEPATLLVDAGDAVQGSLYFTIFKGKVEQMALNNLGYDIQIPGNHEFDNGMEAMTECYADALPTVISSNNDFSATPLRDYVRNYAIKQVGDKRIGFFGLNINPEGMISDRNSRGVVYHDALEAANTAADYLRRVGKVDAVVAVTHIGYTGDPNSGGRLDPEIAAKSRGIDVIVGGHSHTDLRPGDSLTHIANLDGDTVLVVQNAKGGKEVGEVELIFGTNGKIAAKNWRKLRVDSRLDSHADPTLSAMLMPYRMKVDSVASTVTAPIDGDFSPTEMLNFASDYVMERGRRLVGNKRIDLSIMNKGGIRRNFTGNELTVGEIISTFPFENRVVVLEIKGSDLSAVFDIMARQKGNGISHNAKATFKPDFSGCEKVEINGRPIDPNRTYRVATIDYLAGGGDNMTPLKNGRIIAESPVILYRDMLDHLSGNKTLLKRDPNPRFSN